MPALTRCWNCGRHYAAAIREELDVCLECGATQRAHEVILA